MKYYFTLIILLLSIFLFGCVALKSDYKTVLTCKYTWGILSNDSISSDLNYHDSDLSVKISVGKSSLDCIFINNTKSPIEVLWNSSSMVIYGKASGVSNGESLVIDATRSKPNSVLPPNSILTESIIPNCNIKRESNKVVSELFPTEAYHSDSFPQRGEKINLLLAIEVNSKKVYKTINLELLEVRVTEKKEGTSGKAQKEINTTMIYGCLGILAIMTLLFY